LCNTDYINSLVQTVLAFIEAQDALCIILNVKSCWRKKTYFAHVTPLSLSLKQKGDEPNIKCIYICQLEFLLIFFCVMLKMKLVENAKKKCIFISGLRFSDPNVLLK